MSSMITDHTRLHSRVRRGHIHYKICDLYTDHGPFLKPHIRQRHCAHRRDPVVTEINGVRMNESLAKIGKTTLVLTDIIIVCASRSIYLFDWFHLG